MSTKKDADSSSTSSSAAAPAPESLAKSEDVSKVELESVNRPIFLVKMPVFVAKHWHNLPPGAELGRVTMPEEFFAITEAVGREMSPSAKSQTGEVRKRKIAEEAENLRKLSGAELQITAPEILQQGTYPDRHTLKIQSVPNPSYCFIEERQKKRVKMQGTVAARMICEPHDTKTYRTLVKNRQEASEQVTMFLRPYDDSEPASQPKPFTRQAPKKAEAPDKKTRLDRQDLINLLFLHFEQKPYWTLKDLLHVTKQPTVWLKQILTELCTINKKGPNKNKWELKPEYKQRGGGDEAGAG
ncbi:General transcription factor IIF subunit 2 [Balamuthia mandrillaris]